MFSGISTMIFKILRFFYIDKFVESKYFLVAYGFHSQGQKCFVKKLQNYHGLCGCQDIYLGGSKA